MSFRDVGLRMVHARHLHRIIPFSASPFLATITKPPSTRSLSFTTPAHHPQSTSPSTTTYMEPRPSSSVILLSPTNQVLLLHRVHTSTSFASAHVFPGGNLDAAHDGPIPTPEDPHRHRDGPAYRMAAVRECFEETGILLASKAGGGHLIDLPQEQRDEARRLVHSGKVKFGDWLQQIGGVADVDGLIPFTRWLTPANVKKRFTTQMYLYMLPLSRTPSMPTDMLVPTPDNGVEHTEALFASPQAFLARAAAGNIILFPPQVYLLHLLTRFLADQQATTDPDVEVFAEQREKLLGFLSAVPTARTPRGRDHPTAQIPWADKLMSPHTLFIRDSDKRIVLGLDKAGPELKDSGRGGDWEHVALVRFSKSGPSEVEIRLRDDVLAEERATKSKASNL